MNATQAKELSIKSSDDLFEKYTEIIDSSIRDQASCGLFRVNLPVPDVISNRIGDEFRNKGFLVTRFMLKPPMVNNSLNSTDMMFFWGNINNYLKNIPLQFTKVWLPDGYSYEAAKPQISPEKLSIFEKIVKLFKK